MAPEIPVFLACLILSAFFSGSETALLSSSRLRLRRLAADGDAGAATVLDLVRDPRRLLAGILVGNNLVNVLASTMAGSYCQSHYGRGAGAIVAVAVSTVMLVIFSEFLPKTVAALHPIGFSRRVAGWVRLSLHALTPLVLPLEAVTRPMGALLSKKHEPFGIAELRLAVGEGARTGVLDETTERVLRGGLSLGGKTVADILVPRVDVSAIDAGAGYEECFEVFRRDRYSRILVMDGSPDEDVGYLAAKDLALVVPEARPAWKARDGAREALRVPRSLPLPELLVRMRRSGVHFAVVKDEYGGTAGIVTLEDVLEELVGDIRDEHDVDEEAPVRRVGRALWSVRGEVSVKELEERLEISLAGEEEARTIGGLVAEILGRVPREGDAVEREGVRIEAVRVEDNRVVEVRLAVTRP